MCGRYAIVSDPDRLRAHFGYEDRPNFPPRTNVAPTQPVPVVLAECGKRRFALARWGLLPGYVRVPSDFPVLFNARAETAAEKPSFRAAFKRRRCLLPADGFYEWRAEGEGKAKRKVPFVIRRRDGAPLAFAGLWEDWADAEGGQLLTATILTVAANATLAPLHDRMPVLLERQDFDAWLDAEGTPPAAVARLLAPAPDDALEVIEAPAAVNKSGAEVEGFWEARPAPLNSA